MSEHDSRLKHLVDPLLGKLRPAGKLWSGWSVFLSTSLTVLSLARGLYELTAHTYLALSVLRGQSELYFAWSLAFNVLVVAGYWAMGLRGKSIFAGADTESFIARKAPSTWRNRLGRFALQMPVLSTLAVPLYDPNAGIWELVCGSFPQLSLIHI